MITGKHFNSTKLHLPLFLASRNRIKKYNFSAIRTYIIKNYLVSCFEDADKEGEGVQKIEQSYNNSEKRKETPLSHSKTTKTRRTEMSWQLPPNRYNIPDKLGCGKNGIQWSRSENKSQLKKNMKLQNQSAFYEISRNFIEKSKNRCNCHKGKFSTDPRNRRPSSRFMVNNPVTCWRNPNDPSPASYFVGIFEGTSFSKIGKQTIVPCKFLRYSCVPENVRLRFSSKSSFNPGPGRYELLDDEQYLRKRLQIQTQKRFQFRRLHFKYIGLPKQNPGSLKRHIFGYGFTRLFRGSIISSKTTILPKKTQRTDREVRLFPSFEYIKMITNPDRATLSMRTEEDPLPTSNVLRFNCLVKVQKRRQLRDNKKVVFGSGMPRFKDVDTPIIRIQSKSPPLVNFPIMTVNPKEIKTKLDAIPERLRVMYKCDRIQPFKFQSIPPVKLLINEKEFHPASGESFKDYPKQLNPKEFLKDQFKKNLD